jgi:uncharacterized protein YdaU (DUF1376 family)
MHYYSHHIGDYRSNTAHLSNEEDLAYRRLLEMYYDTEQPIPLETQWVARRLRVAVEALQSVLEDFFLLTDGGWTHQRCDRELRQYHIVQERNKVNGSKGGRPKSKNDDKNNPLGSQSVASRLPVETERKGNQEPITKNQEPLTKEEQYSAEVSSQVAVAPKPKPAKDVLGVDFLIAQGCEESHARDWMKARRAKKAPLTETAWDGLCREARKAGISPSEAVRMCAARSWASLKAEWLTKDQGQQETTYQRTMREKYEKWVPSLAAKAPAAKRDVFEVIDEIRPTTPPALG